MDYLCCFTVVAFILWCVPTFTGSTASSFPTVLGLKYCFVSGGFFSCFFLLLFFIFQTLAECKQRPAFSRLLKLYEEKAVCGGRTIENYLTAPMHRVSNQESLQHYPIRAIHLYPLTAPYSILGNKHYMLFCCTIFITTFFSLSDSRKLVFFKTMLAKERFCKVPAMHGSLWTRPFDIFKGSCMSGTYFLFGLICC